MDKKFRPVYIKQIDTDKLTISAYVSTYQWDRMNERFEKGAWKLDNFRANPVVLWAHNSFETPIAKAIEIFEDDIGLLAIMQFDPKGEKAMEVFSLYQRGFLNTFSVGFIPDFKTMRREKIEGTENE